MPSPFPLERLRELRPGKMSPAELAGKIGSDARQISIITKAKPRLITGGAG